MQNKVLVCDNKKCANWQHNLSGWEGGGTHCHLSMGVPPSLVQDQNQDLG